MLKLEGGSAVPVRATADSNIASGAPEIASRDPPCPPLLRGGERNPMSNWAVEGATGASLARDLSAGDARLTSMGAAARGSSAATPMRLGPPTSAAVKRL